MSPVKVARSMMREYGLRGFFQGVLPPLLGSALYRGAMMSGYEYTFTYIQLHTPDDHVLKRELFGGIRPMVPVAVVCASLFRGVIEAPFEYAKLMGQTNQKLEINALFRGLHWQMLRTTLLLLPIFTVFDVLRRKTTVLATLPGNFVVTFGAVGLSYACSWPVETLKNLAQAAKPHAGASISQRISFMGGPLGLFTGMSPGAVGGGLRNACGMIAMIYAQKLATYAGLRDM